MWEIMQNEKRRRFGKYYTIPFSFNDEGHVQKRFLRVQRGCKFLRNEERSYTPNNKYPKKIDGRRVVGWINTYSADD
jgi:hypothetical protein